MSDKPTRMFLAFDTPEAAEEFLKMMATAFQEVDGESLMTRWETPMYATIDSLDFSEHYTPINKLTWGDEEVIFIDIKSKGS